MRWRRAAAWVAAGGLVVLAAVAAWAWTPDLPRAELEARYRQGEMLDIAGVRLHVQDSGGDKPALLLLHGFGASLHTWDAWADALSASHRVVRFDLPGSGLSAPDPSGDYSDARSLELLIALMDRLGLQQAAVAGHSIGGRIAWTFAARHPERVTRLVLIAPDGFASAGFEYGRAPEVGPSVELMRWTLPRLLLKLSLEPAYGDPSLIDEALVDRYHALMLAPGTRDAMIARLRQTVLVDPVPLLRSIRAPTLLVWGDADQAIPVDNAADYQRALPDVRLLRLPGIGHLPHEERPALALPAVRDFLAAGALPPR